jgi:signal transduction histidine kinase
VVNSRLRWGVGAFGAVLIVGFVAMIGENLRREHAALLQEAHDKTRGLAILLERHATDSFGLVDKILLGTGEVLSIHPDAANPGAPSIHALLQRQAGQTTLIRTLLVVAEDGMLLHDSNRPLLPALQLSDRDYVRSHRMGQTSEVFIGHPTRGRLSDLWVIGVSRRLEKPDGRFAGVVAALVEPSAFRQVYETLSMPAGTVVTLFHRDGTVLARHPGHDASVGRPILDLPSPAAIPVGDKGLEDGDRILNLRASSTLPLSVLVSVSRKAVLAPWYGSLVIGAGFALMGGLLIGYLTWRLAREIGRRERMLSELQASEQALRKSQTLLTADIAARHRVEAELIAATRASDAANRAKTQFLANMSHELRTPLNAIIGFAEALEAGIFGGLTSKQGEYVGDIRRAGLHLLSLINDILDSTKIESGKYILRERILSVQDSVAECLRQIEPLAAEKRVTLAARLPSGLPDLYADERAFKQILLNLLSNAVKFTPSGGRTELSATLTEGGGLALTVADSGIGIAPKDLERVLEPFHQVDNSHTRRYSGTGLGLPLVKSLIELHGGRLMLESRLGQGTSATVSYPAKRLYVAQMQALKSVP